jgi:TPR repeat protein
MEAMDLPGDAKDRSERRARIPEWTAAAEAGNVDAQLKLAWEYARGDAVDADIVKAWNLFDRAAASGQEDALVNRARFLQLRGAPTGLSEIRALAAKGNWKAQFWVAQHYRAHADRISRLRAAVWYDRSLRNGGGPAAKLAQLGLLVRIASIWLKPFFICKALIEAAPIIWRAARAGEEDAEIKLLEPLLYRLKNRNG